MLQSDLHKLLEGTADAAFVVDAQGVTRSWNQAAEKLLGIRAQDAIGQPCAGLMDGQGALGTLVCGHDCHVLQSLAAGREIPNFDINVKTGSGQRLWVNVSVLQFYDSRTRHRLAIHLMRDIAARKKNEELGQKLLDAAKDLVALSGDPVPLPPVSQLTEREQKLLRSLATGRSPAEVASELGITGRTLRNHLYRVNRKLRTRNRLQAVIHAQRCGLI